MTDNHDLHCARGWLARASDVLTGAEDYLSAVEYAHAAAVIGNGYVNLAHATQALESMAATARRRAVFDATAEREERAVAEARPHDRCAHETEYERLCKSCRTAGDDGGETESRPRDDAEKPDGIVYVVEGDDGGARYAASTDERARAWIKTADGSYGDNLTVTALAVDRG